jgi:hypothetical protein
MDFLQITEKTIYETRKVLSNEEFNFLNQNFKRSIRLTVLEATQIFEFQLVSIHSN